MKQRLTDEGDLRKYFAAIPNIVFTLGLNPYELALYSHFKQAAGDNGGVCWKSRATIAKETHMSAGMVSKARASLAKPQSLLGGFPLIRIEETAHKDGGKPTCHVTVTDIWPINMAHYAPSPRDVDTVTTSPRGLATSYSDGATSPRGHKEELLKKNSEEDKRDFIAELRQDPLYSHVDFDLQFDLMRRWLGRHKGRRLTERFVLNWLAGIDRPVEIPANGNGHDAAWHEKQAKLAEKLGRVYQRPTTT